MAQAERLKHRLVSNEYRHVELLTSDVRRRRWATEQKLMIIKYSFEPRETVSSTARRHGVAPNLLHRWRRLLREGGAGAADLDEPVVGNSEIKKLEDRVRELERILGRRTMGAENLRNALSKADSKTDIAAEPIAEGRFAMKTVVDTLGVSRSNVINRVKVKSKPHGPYHKVGDAELLPVIRSLADQRPIYRYIRIAALLNRERRATDKDVFNAKRVHCIMGNHAMPLEALGRSQGPHPWREGIGYTIQPELVFGRPGVHLLE